MAVSIASKKNVSTNDALAYVCMRANRIGEIYSFDKHFDQFSDITRMPEI